MLMSLAIFLGLVYIVVHFSREKNLVKWRARIDPLRPVGRTFVTDVRITRQYARDWPRRIRDRTTFRKLRRTYDEY